MLVTLVFVNKAINPTTESTVFNSFRIFCLRAIYELHIANRLIGIKSAEI